MILTIVTSVIKISFLYIKIYEKISSLSEKKYALLLTSYELSITGLIQREYCTGVAFSCILHHPLPIGTSFKFFTHWKAYLTKQDKKELMQLLEKAQNSSRGGRTIKIK